MRLSCGHLEFLRPAMVCIDLAVARDVDVLDFHVAKKCAGDRGCLGEKIPCGALGLVRDGATSAHHRIVDEPLRPLTHHRPKRAPSKLLCQCGP